MITWQSDPFHIYLAETSQDKDVVIPHAFSSTYLLSFLFPRSYAYSHKLKEKEILAL